MEKDQEPQGGLWQEKDTVTPPTHPILIHWSLRTLKPPWRVGLRCTSFAKEDSRPRKRTTWARGMWQGQRSNTRPSENACRWGN